MNELRDALWSLIGRDAEDLTSYQMTVRAIVVFIAALVMVRAGEKRFLGKNTAFDVILGIVLGSVVSRAITGSAPFIPTLAAGFVLVGLHWVFAALAFRSERFATLVKGESRLLIEDGELRHDALRKSHLGQRDLLSALRSNGRLTDPGDVAEARLERSGAISVISKQDPPRIVDVAVADGVQVVRIELG